MAVPIRENKNLWRQKFQDGGAAFNVANYYQYSIPVLLSFKNFR